MNIAFGLCIWILKSIGSTDYPQSMTYFFHYYDKIPEKENLSKEGLTFTQSSMSTLSGPYR